MQEVKLPQLGQSVEEASIVAWLKKEGDEVKAGDPLFSIQTDKAEIECEASAAGILRKILVGPDIEVPVLTVVALVGEKDEPLPDLSQYQSGGGGESAPTASASAPVAAASAVTSSPGATPASGGQGQAVSPRARRKAAALGVDPSRAQGSGAGGRVMEADVVAFAESGASPKMTPTARRLAELEQINVSDMTGTGAAGKITKADVERAMAAPAVASTAAAAMGEVIPLTPMRRIIAGRMASSKFSAPHYYVTVEVDMAKAKHFREGIGAFKPSFNDLVMRAAARAIQQIPQVNARWGEDHIEIAGEINLGFAVALPTGLIVPVVKNVQDMSLRQIHDASRVLAEKARTNKLTPDDYSGSTFTISNLGAFGVDQFTAIINQPNSAILAVGQIKDAVVVIDGGIHVRPVMKMTLSSDHRVVDGAVAAQFMGVLKNTLESADF